MDEIFREAEEWIQTQNLAVHFVYALLDEDGQVLYVGTTKDAYKRLRQHKTEDLANQKFGGRAAKALVLDAGLNENEAYLREQERYDELKPEFNKGRPHGFRRAGPEEDHI